MPAIAFLSYGPAADLVDIVNQFAAQVNANPNFSGVGTPTFWPNLREDILRNRGPVGTYGFRDLVGNIVVKGTGANDPTWASFVGGINAYSFSATTMKEVWLTFHIDHDYAPGTPIYLHTHWSTTGTNTGVCRWGFEYTVAKGHQQQVFPATTTVYVEQAGSGQALRHMIAEIVLDDAVPSTNLEPDTLLLVRCFRDAANGADTLSDAAFLLTMDCHYQVDGISTKNRAPNFNT